MNFVHSSVQVQPDFNIKLKELLKDINECCALGKTVSHMSVIEYQKRYLKIFYVLSSSLYFIDGVQQFTYML